MPSQQRGQKNKKQPANPSWTPNQMAQGSIQRGQMEELQMQMMQQQFMNSSQSKHSGGGTPFMMYPSQVEMQQYSSQNATSKHPNKRSKVADANSQFMQPPNMMNPDLMMAAPDALKDFQADKSLHIDQCNTAEEFLSRVSHSIPTSELYELLSTCQTSEENDFCPVLIKIVNKELQTLYQGRYLLQVWSRKLKGQIIFQKILQYQVAHWNIIGEHMTYVLNERESTGDRTSLQIYIVKLSRNPQKQSLAVINTHEFTCFGNPDSKKALKRIFSILAYTQHTLIAANSQLMKFTYVSSSAFEPCGIHLDDRSLNVNANSKFYSFDTVSLNSSVKIHNIVEINDYQAALIVEGRGNQLNFLKIQMKDGQPVFIELNDAASLKKSNDDCIKKVCSIMFMDDVEKKYSHCALALHESGSLDFYWNFRIVEQNVIEDEDYYYSDIEIQFKTMYFKRSPIEMAQSLNMDQNKIQNSQNDEDESDDDVLVGDKFSGKQEIFACPTSWRQRIGLSQSQKLDLQPDKVEEFWKTILHLKLANHLELYPWFSGYSNYYVVVHNKFLSLFDINEQKWVHQEQDDIIRTGFNIPVGPAIYHIGLLLNDSTLRFQYSKDSINHQKDHPLPKGIISAGGHVKAFCRDIVDRFGFYMVVMVPDIEEVMAPEPVAKAERATLRFHYKIKMFHRDNLYDLDIQQVREDTTVMIEYNKESGGANIERKVLVVDSILAKKTVRYYITEVEDENGKLVPKATRIKQGSKKIQDDFSMQRFEDTGQMKGRINQEGEINQAFVHVSEKKMHLTDLEQYKQGKVIDNTNIRNILFLDQWMYTLSDQFIPIQGDKKKQVKAESQQQQQMEPAGLYVYDMKRFLESGDVETYKLKEAIVGVNCNIDYCKVSQRIAYLKNFNTIEMVPIPHRNTINFIGMQPKQQYLIWRQLNGTFNALDKQGQLKTWVIATGKTTKPQITLDNIDVQGYQLYRNDETDFIYTSNWQQRKEKTVTLLISEDKHDFYGEEEKSILAENQNAIYENYSSQINASYYNFKVLSIDNEFVKEEYSFYMPCYITEDPKVKGKVIQKKLQRLYLSEDLTKLMEVLDDSRCHIYIKIPQPGKDKEIKWQLLYQIKRYPTILQGLTSANFLFSPNFVYYIEIDFFKEQFVIKNCSDGKTVYYIPRGIFGFNQDEKINMNIQHLASKIFFASENEIQIISRENLQTSFKLTGDPEAPLKIDYYAMDTNKIDLKQKDNHQILDRQFIQRSDTLDRLMRLNQRFKFLAQQIRKEVDPDDIDEISKRLHEELMTVDYSQHWNDAGSQFTAEMCFTILDWQIVEKLVYDNKFRLDKIDSKQQLQLCYNVFPNIKTILHIIAESNTIDLDEVQELFNNAQNFSAYDKMTTTIPILQDVNGNTPIDLSLNSNEEADINLANLLLSNIKDYPYMHSGQLLSNSIIKAIKYKVPVLGEFLDSRLVQSPHMMCQMLNRKAIMQSKQKKVHGYIYGVIEADPWHDQDQLVKELFDTNSFEKSIKMLYFDIPYIHTYNAQGKDFFHHLTNHDDIDLFARKSIQIIINHKWPIVRKQIMKYIFIPNLIWLAIFFIWDNMIRDHAKVDPKQYQAANILCGVLLILFSCYFFIIETLQLKSLGVSYLKSPWTYLDLVCVVLIFRNAVIAIGKLQSENDAIYQAVGTLAMWAKMFFFFRMWDSTNYLAKMIMKVAGDLGAFTIIFMLGLIAFASSFLSLSEANSPEHQFLRGFYDSFVYTYLIALGAFDTSHFENNAEVFYIFFLLCTIFNMIVLLNLIIAIISDTFNNVSTKSEQYSYREKASCVADYQDIIPGVKTNKIWDQEDYLLIAWETEPVEAQESQVTLDMVADQVTECKNRLEYVLKQDEGSTDHKKKYSQSEHPQDAVPNKVNDQC